MTPEEKKAKHRQQSAARMKNYYQKHIATDQITVYCEFCKLEHTALRLTYDKNIARNGRYICEKEGGHIVGSKPKLSLRKENPYAIEGKKECNGCKDVKLFEEFSPDRTKRDGLCTVCKLCRSAKNKAAYIAKKSK